MQCELQNLYKLVFFYPQAADRDTYVKRTLQLICNPDNNNSSVECVQNYSMYILSKMCYV